MICCSLLCVQNTAREDMPQQYAPRVKPQIKHRDSACEILNSKNLKRTTFKF
nr:hypothetical protein [uncultured Campylobacter sp.]